MVIFRTTPDSFDIYMAAGGTGAVKGCFNEPEDCAKPTCAARDWVTGNNAGTPHTLEGDHNSFYTCSGDGVPWTE